MGQEKNAYSITYHPLVADDVRRLDHAWQQKVRAVIEQKLTTEPEVFGTPLRQSLRSHRKLRIGDYRIVYRIEKKTVRIIAIVHRSSGYKKATKRA